MCRPESQSRHVAIDFSRARAESEITDEAVYSNFAFILQKRVRERHFHRYSDDARVDLEIAFDTPLTKFIPFSREAEHRVQPRVVFSDGAGRIALGVA